MKNKNIIFLVFLFAFLIAGCDSKKPENDDINIDLPNQVSLPVLALAYDENNQLIIDWDEGSSEQSYTLVLSRAEDFESEQVSEIILEAPPYVVPAEPGGLEYFARLRIKDNEQEDLVSDPLRFVAPPLSPVALNNLIIDATNIRLTWESVEGVDRYDLYRSSDEEIDTTSVTVIENVTSPYEDNVEVDGQTYFYWLVAILNDQVSAFSPVSQAELESYQIQKPTFNSSSEFIVDENSVLVGVVSANDESESALAFAIEGGDDADLFIIDAETGELKLINALEYEDAVDESTNNSYQLIVSVNNGTYLVSQIIEVIIRDVQENQPPEFIGNSSVTVNENHIDAIEFQFADPEGDELSFSLTGGEDAELFSIDSQTGELSFVTAPNFEEPIDSNNDNSYVLLIDISDGEFSVQQEINIAVLDVDETPVIVNFDVSQIEVLESELQVSADIVLNKESSNDVHVRLNTIAGSATADDFYEVVSEEIVISKGEIQKSYTLTLVDDDLYEGPVVESFVLEIESVVNATLGDVSQLVVNVVDNEVSLPIVEFQTATQSVYEQNGSIEIVASLDKAVENDVHLIVSTVEDSATSEDFVPLADYGVTIPAGETQQVFNIEIIEDNTPEEELGEIFVVEIVSAEGAIVGGLSRTSITVFDSNIIASQQWVKETSLTAQPLISIAVDPVDSNKIFVGADAVQNSVSSGGLYRSTGSANIRTWSQVFASSLNGQPIFTGQQVRAIAISPDTQLSSQMMFASVSGKGLYKSLDGTTWVNTPLIPDNFFDLPTISQIVMSKRVNNIQRTYVLVQGDFNQTAGTAGIYASSDGTNWTKLLNVVNPMKIAVVPNEPNTIYVSTLSGELIKSTDGGINFQAANSGLPTGFIIDFVVDPANANNVYASAFESSTPTVSGFYFSVNGGLSWTRSSADLFSLLAVGRSTTDVSSEIYGVRNESATAIPFYTVFKSTNNGLTWQKVDLTNAGLTGQRINVIAITNNVSSAGDIIYAATDDGLYVYGENPVAMDSPIPINSTLSVPANSQTAVTGILQAQRVNPTDTLTFEIVTNATQGVMTIVSPTTGSFTFTPNFGAIGTDTVTFRVRDQLGRLSSVNGVVTIEHGSSAGSTGPIPNNLTVTVPTGSTAVADVLTAQKVTPTDTLTYTIVSAAVRGVFTIINPTTGAFTYIQNAGQTGTDTITFRVTDQLQRQSTTNGTVTINLADDSLTVPRALNSTVTVPAGSANVTGSLQAQRVSATDTLTFEVVGNATKGTFTLTNAEIGAFTYAPMIDQTGTDTVTFRVTDQLQRSSITNGILTINLGSATTTGVDISIVASTQQASIQSGADLTYDVRVSNLSTTTSSSQVTLTTSAIPAGVTLVKPGTYDTCTLGENQMITCDISSLRRQNTVTVSIILQMPDVLNVEEISLNFLISSQGDLNIQNNSSLVVVPVI